jgi:hypothetical protein
MGSLRLETRSGSKIERGRSGKEAPGQIRADLTARDPRVQAFAAPPVPLVAEENRMLP